MEEVDWDVESVGSLRICADWALCQANIATHTGVSKVCVQVWRSGCEGSHVGKGAEKASGVLLLQRGGQDNPR